MHDDPPPPEWAAERRVSPELARALVAGQFPELAGAPVELLAEGWDNTVYRVDRRLVFRFPRRTVALPGIRRELAVLPRLAPRLPLPVPVPRYVGAPTAGYPWPWWGAALVPGRELADVPDSAGSVALGAQVGSFLRALHDTDPAGWDLPYDPMRRGEPAVRAPMARERLARLDRLAPGVAPAGPALDALLAVGDRTGPPAPGDAVLCHGDLHLRHLLLDPAGRAGGVIDWGDLCVGDPAVDLSIAYAGFAGPARAALLAAYGPVDPVRAVRARVAAVSVCAALAEQAATDRRDRLRDAALAGVRRAVGDGGRPGRGPVRGSLTA